MDCKVSISKYNNQHSSISIDGNWTKNKLHQIEITLEKIFTNLEKQIVEIDFSGTTDIDSSGIILILKYIKLSEINNISISIININHTHNELLNFYQNNSLDVQQDTLSNKKSYLYTIGKTFYTYWSDFLLFLNFLGSNVYYAFYVLRYPSKIRHKAIIKELDISGIQALPIVVLTSFLIGLVIAYQASDQLKQFGANIFIVEMVSISVMRELAPMITAIVIAGRSASSYTAQIGTMKITEEIDAMKTMGFEPSIFLVQPRIIALMIALPLIVFLADLVGILGGIVVAYIQLDITYVEFIDRLYTQVDIKHFYLGLIKAPVFGFVIAIIGCYRGFQVSGSTDSVGKYTTISVVNAIFWVIALNAIFSIIFTQLGL